MPHSSNSLTSSGLPEKEFFAVKNFLLNSTVPLIYENGDVIGVLGTGCLFDFNEALFFVTAGHVLEQIDPDALGVPLRRLDSEVFSLGPGIVGWSRQDEFDVAAYRIDDTQVVTQLRQSYTVLSEANIKHGECDNDHYIVPGYPTATVSRQDNQLKTKDLTQIYTTRYDGPVVGARTQFDHFLKLSRTAKRLWGHVIEVPDLRGISGAPVWQVCESRTSIWTPESILHLVGIQVAVDPRAEKYIRVLSWDVVRHALRKLQKRN